MLPKSNLACRSVKQLNPIIPSTDVGNFQTKKWMTEGYSTHLKWDLLFPHEIQAVSLYSERLKCSIFEWYLRYPRLQRLQLEPESTMRIRSEPRILSTTVGLPWSRVTGTVTKLLTALGGNLRWKLQPWLSSATSIPDDGCFVEQLKHRCCLTFPFPVVWCVDSFPRSFWGKFIRKAFFGKISWFPTLKTKYFPFATSVCQACFCWRCFRPTCGASVLTRAACPYSDLPKVFQGWPKLSLPLLRVSEFEKMLNFFPLVFLPQTLWPQFEVLIQLSGEFEI